MATIGRVTRNTQDNSFEGFLKTMTIECGIRFVPIANPSPKGPNWRIFTDNGFEVGAAWQKTAQSGQDYISASFDGPELPSRLYANLGREAGQDDEDVFALIWNRN
ncbi:MAG: DUF736 domain-containing protein [Paracoccaceae bacterium]